MNILVCNTGSTTIKYKCFIEHDLLVSGRIDQKVDKYVCTIDKAQKTYEWEISEAQFANPISLIAKEVAGVKIDVVAHRVVHGGEKYIKPTLLTTEVISELKKFNELAPLHNPPALKLINQFKSKWSDVSQWAVFDTAFYATLSAKAFTYAIPLEYYQQHAIRRYGFHGTSHKYVLKQLKKLEPSAQKVISLHLGGGSSITASLKGKAIDTSMGMTPMEGLMMASRSGDIDPGAVIYLQKLLASDPQKLNHLLNNQSGILGIYGKSNDMRDVLSGLAQKDPRAKLALEMYVYRIQKYIGAYFAVLKGLDALIITAGVGQGSDVIRSLICRDLLHLGIKLDERYNKGRINVSDILKISSSYSIPVWIIPTDEEKQIASEVRSALKS